MRHCDSYANVIILFGRQSYISHKFHAHIIEFLLYKNFMLTIRSQFIVESAIYFHVIVHHQRFEPSRKKIYFFLCITRFTPLCNFFIEVTPKNTHKYNNFNFLHPWCKSRVKKKIINFIDYLRFVLKAIY